MPALFSSAWFSLLHQNDAKMRNFVTNRLCRGVSASGLLQRKKPQNLLKKPRLLRL
jgi:hypothetical protein